VGEGLSAQGYDQIGYSFTWDKFLFTQNFHYQKFYAYVPGADFRMLLGHRATADWGRVTFGVSEAALLNKDAPCFYYLPLPFVPTYLYTYTSYHPGGFDPDLSWTYKGRILGDPLGPDADRLNLELLWEKSPEWQWNFAYTLELRGAGTIGDEWRYQPGVTEIFLTETIETGNTLDVSLTRKYRDYEITLLLGAEHLNNAGNVDGADEINPRLTVWGTYRF
jgi:hypothetical protein